MDLMDGDQVSLEALQAVLDEHFAPWVLRLGLKVSAASRQHVALTMHAGAELHRQGNMVCGQALVAAADTAMALASIVAVGEFTPTATVDINTSFLRAARNPSLLIEGFVVKPGRRLTFTRAQITDTSTGKPVASATATFAMP